MSEGSALAARWEAGVFGASLRANKARHIKIVGDLSSGLASLQNQSDDFADQHRELIKMHTEILGVIRRYEDLWCKP